jgi:signal recognition particle subunit SEC65
LRSQPVADKDVQAALEEAGLDFRHNAEIQPPRIWVNNHPEVIENTPA